MVKLRKPLMDKAGSMQRDIETPRMISQVGMRMEV
jgi:hypothetical protein